MATDLTTDQMKQFVRNHFEDFVNRRKAAVIHTNMTPDFFDPDGPGGKPTDVAGDERHSGLQVLGARGKKMQFHGFVLWRFEGGKIAERWATVTPPAEQAAWTSWNAAPQSVAAKKTSQVGER